MNHMEDTLTGVNDVKLYYQVWRPDETTKAVIQIIHGFGEHSSRYMNVIDELIPRGYVIYADDHRGHGKSEGDKMYVKKFDEFIEDEKILFDLIKKKEPNLPHFILGHSMGSTIAELFTVKYPEGIKGLILSGVGTRIKAISGMKKALAKFFGAISPKMKSSADLAPQLSHDPDVVKAYREDSLVSNDATVRLGAEFARGVDKSKKILNQIKIPTLVQAGSGDQIMLGADKFEELLTTADKTIKIYEGLYHEVYNELEADRKRVLTDLAEWLDKHI